CFLLLWISCCAKGGGAGRTGRQRHHRAYRTRSALAPRARSVGARRASPTHDGSAVGVQATPRERALGIVRRPRLNFWHWRTRSVDGRVVAEDGLRPTSPSQWGRSGGTAVVINAAKEGLMQQSAVS